jgi:ribosomal protein S18 acetylase RimI-like enzyme
MDSRIHIDSMKPSDIALVVGLQLAFLDGSVVTELGGRFLTRFQTCALAHTSACGFVARDPDSRIVGFALGSVDVDRFNRDVKPRVFWSLVWSLLNGRLRLLPSILRSLVEPPPTPHLDAELLLLVVEPRARRCGVGGALLNAVEEEFARHEVSRYRVAVRSHLGGARAFYIARRFEYELERDVLGRPMVYLTKRIGLHDTAPRPQ